MRLTIREVIERRARAAPEAAVLCAPRRETLRAAELESFVRSTGERLRELGVRRTDRVALALPNGPQAASAFLAVTSVATCAPLNPGYRKTEFDFYLSDLGAAALLVPAGGQAAAAIESARERGVAVFELALPEGAPAGVFELVGEPFARAVAGSPEEPQAPGLEDTALVLHTSGTTSRPKVVPLSQRNLCASAQNIAATLQLRAADRCLNVMPLFHIHGLLGVLLSSLHAGASVAATPGFQAASFFDWLEEFEASWYSAVPTMHQAVLARAEKQPDALRKSRLRLIRSSSSALAPKLLADLERVFGVPVVEAYGMTEAAHQMASNPLPPAARKPGSVGPAAGPQVRVLDEQWQALPAGQVGEVAIRGENVTAGYEKNPDANAQAFRDSWFRTGDQGYLDADGYLFLTGRLKEIINRGGEKISPREIDEVLLEHPAVAQVVAFAMPDPKLGEEVAAAIVLREGATLEKRELLAFAAQRLADFKLPRELVFVDEIPKGPTGKLQRIGLAQRLGVGRASDAPETRAGRAPQTATEQLVARLFGELLELDSVDARSDFLALGGDSLVAGQLIQALAEATGVTLPLYELFQEPTVERLAAFLESADQPAVSTATIPDAGPGPQALSFGQYGLWVQERLSGGSPLNHRFGALELRGALDVARLERAMTEVFRRHEVLRAHFPIVERRPVQQVQQLGALSIPVRAWDGSSHGDRASFLAAAARELVEQPFDLESGPIHRFELIALSEREHVLLSVFHHIVFDGWSMSVLCSELARAYDELSSAVEAGSSEAGTREPGTRYADYAAWQRALVERGELQAQIEAWRARLVGEPQRLELPGSRPRPEQVTLADLRAARRDVVVPEDVHAGLVALGVSEGATLFMTLLAAFDALLCRWSGLEDLWVGTLVAGRTRRETLDQIGLFANTLVLRSDLSGDPSFRELCARVRQTALEAYAGAEVPFEVLVRELAPRMVPGRNPYFDVVFQLRNLPVAQATTGALEIEPSTLESGYARFDLLLEAYEQEGRLHTRFEYRTRRFPEELMQCWTARWERLLEAVVEDPDVRLSALALESYDPGL